VSLQLSNLALDRATRLTHKLGLGLELGLGLGLGLMVIKLRVSGSGEPYKFRIE
jgi:hypothetical protein